MGLSSVGLRGPGPLWGPLSFLLLGCLGSHACLSEGCAYLIPVGATIRGGWSTSRNRTLSLPPDSWLMAGCRGTSASLMLFGAGESCVFRCFFRPDSASRLGQVPLGSWAFWSGAATLEHNWGELPPRGLLAVLCALLLLRRIFTNIFRFVLQLRLPSGVPPYRCSSSLASMRGALR